MPQISTARVGALVWAIWIGWVLALPGDSVIWLSEWLPPLPGLDKVVHAGLFFVLALWLVPALGPRFGSRPRRLWAAFGLASGYGGLTEAGQLFLTERSAELGDIAADMVGAALAVGLTAGLRTRVARAPTETE